jgi:hypothetical protein
VSYDDLIELADLCLRRAAATSNAATAAALRALAGEYRARAARLGEARPPPNVAPPLAQPLQQQQPQPPADPVRPGDDDDKKLSD